jgi:type IV pilus assembly protein PilW
LPTTSVADRYLRADQMTVAANPVGTNANWRRVRSLRIGMILRGPAGSSPESTTQPTLYPLGQAPDSNGGSAGSALSSASDPGTIYSPTADRRLRQVVTFTVHLRNDQGL